MRLTNNPPAVAEDASNWSPDGKELVFAMKGSIWRLKLGESTAYELTTGAGYASEPAWSPDGRWIVYTALSENS